MITEENHKVSAAKFGTTDREHSSCIRASLIAKLINNAATKCLKKWPLFKTAPKTNASAAPEFEECVDRNWKWATKYCYSRVNACLPVHRLKVLPRPGLSQVTITVLRVQSSFQPWQQTNWTFRAKSNHRKKSLINLQQLSFHCFAEKPRFWRLSNKDGLNLQQQR